MNIFLLHKDPIIAAQYLIDSHVNKMIIESGQMLANCYTPEQLSDPACPRTINGNVRKHSYFNHPCSKWVRASLSNFNWLVIHALAIEEEKLYRVGKGHYSGMFIRWCAENKPSIKDIGLTPVALAVGDSSRIENDPVKSYQLYYTNTKKYDKNGKRMDIYTRRKRPDFWK